jgi:predicted AlkP superfamily pyrophosphatase or phosphodiesterase
MKAVLPLFVFIDACGWEIIKNDPFVQDCAPQRKRLTSVFGYSSACVPSILSGRWPAEHRNWSYFVYDPERSPFRPLHALRWLPKALTSRRRFRCWLSRLLKARLGFRGYFDLYNLPFEHIALFDFSEKRSPLQPGGMNRGPNIFDYLEDHGIRYHVSAPQRSESANLAALLQDIASETIDFAFLYWPGLDGLLHRVGNRSPEISPKLREYEQWIRQLQKTAEAHYEEVRLYVFSDHGMANCDVHVDVKAQIETLPLRMGHDYAAVYDSTMARFWFLKPGARAPIVECLQGITQGRIIPDSELKELRSFFNDRYFGELIFLVKEGVLIVPSDMGERPIRAMHGYHPCEPQSYAVLCTNQAEIPETVQAIPDIHQLMTRDAELAQERNASVPSKQATPGPKQATGAKAAALG